MTVGGTGLGTSEEAPCYENMCGNKKTQGTHCLVIPQVLLSSGSLLSFFSLSSRYFLCLLYYVQEFLLEDLGGMKLLHFGGTRSSIDFYSSASLNCEVLPKAIMPCE